MFDAATKAEAAVSARSRVPSRLDLCYLECITSRVRTSAHSQITLILWTWQAETYPSGRPIPQNRREAIHRLGNPAPDARAFDRRLALRPRRRPVHICRPRGGSAALLASFLAIPDAVRGRKFVCWLSQAANCAGALVRGRGWFPRTRRSGCPGASGAAWLTPRVRPGRTFYWRELGEWFGCATVRARAHHRTPTG